MKRIYFLLIAIGLMLASCSESFLDTEPLTKKVDANFYQTPTDAENALTAVYAALPAAQTHQSFYLTSEVMSDDRFAGGGINDIQIISTGSFRMASESHYEDVWQRYYEGIFRANMLIDKIDQVQWENEDQRGNIEGQAHFLRAYFYMDLARMFGKVPLVIRTAPVNLPKSTPDSIWGVVAYDLKMAIEKFPEVKWASMPIEDFGKATKWAAEGLMARAFLFYTGYYEKSEMPILVPEEEPYFEGSVTKDDVIEWIDNCVDNSGHDLLPDFRSLWPYSYAKDVYKYAADNNLSWIDEEGDNYETVFAMPFGNLADWGTSIYYSNQYCLYQGLRAQSLVPFGQGWGMGTVNPQLWDEWPEEDMRKKASICDVNDPDEGIEGYTWGGDKQMHETGYWSKKYMPINVKNASGRNVNMSVMLYGAADNFQLNNVQDMVIIRFADILLMGAELGGPNAQKYLDRVRARVGLTSVPVTLENIKAERRFELAFEGGRYHDILRWHDVEKEYQTIKDIPVMNEGVAAKHTVVYRPATGGFLPIPNSQILLSNGVLTQNEGWDVPEALYQN